jgi:ABC-type sugar transport system substrate-binding protein
MKRLFTVVMILICLSGMLFASAQQESQDDGKITVAGLVFQADTFMNVILDGMKAAADKHGADLLTANTDNKPDKEVQMIDTYIAAEVDAIAITPISATASITALQRAHDKGIPVVLFNTSLESNFHVSYVKSSQYTLGASSGAAAKKFIQEELGGKAKVATLAFQSQVPEQSNARVNGFLDQIKDLPGVEIVAQQDAWLPEMAVKKIGDIITANPELDVVYAANEGGTVGATMGIKNAGLAGKVFVFGIDQTPQLAEFLMADDNILQAVTAQDPFNMGYMAVDFAIRSLKGEKVEAEVVVPGALMTREDQAAVQAYLDAQ